MIKLIVFDLEGTTVDDQNVVYNTLADLLNAEGYNITFKQVLRAAARKEKKEAIRSLVDQTGQKAKKDTIDGLFAKFNEQLKRAYTELDVAPCPNADRVIPFLRTQNIKVVLNTEHHRFTAQHLLHRIKWWQGAQYDLLVTPEDVERSRPAPDMIQYAQNQLGIPEAHKVAKVGDAPIDITEGKNASCGLTIGITTGVHSLQQLNSAQPDHIIDDLEELIPILNL